MGRAVRGAILSRQTQDALCAAAAARIRVLRSLELGFANQPGRIERIGALYQPQVEWHGPHPINDCSGRDAVLRTFWGPLLAAMPDLERRDDIVLTGAWKDAVWVASTGHYTGRFVADWLEIPADGRVISLRFGEFARWEEAGIAEAYVIIDILHLLRQVDRWPLAPPLGASDRVPGPSTHDGVRAVESDPSESQLSLSLVEAMIAGLMRYDRQSLDSMEQWRYWHPDFTWYGPAGIGTCRGQEDYRRCHQRPFLEAFPDRVGGNHKCRIADGRYVASTGWPSIRATHLGGGFLGTPPTGRSVTMRVMDFWRREDDALRENWVFIDLLDLLMQTGLDVFERMRAAGQLRARPGGGTSW